MIFVIYLYYMLYKCTESFANFFYEHSPLTPKDKSLRKGQETLRLNVIFYSSGLFVVGEILYLGCILLLLYHCGVTQVKMIFNKDYRFLWVVLIMVMSGIIEYFLLERNERFKRYSEDFAQYSFEKKLCYGFVALLLFIFPIVALFYGFSAL